MARALLALVIVACLVGCGPSGGGSSSVAPAAGAAPAIEWRAASGLSAEQRTLVEARWRAYLAIEARNRGQGALRIDVARFYGWDVAELPAHPGLWGWSTWGTRGRIEVDVIVGGDLAVDVAYHELCHVRSRLESHDDPRWALWEQERAAAVAEVLASTR